MPKPDQQSDFWTPPRIGGKYTRAADRCDALIIGRIPPPDDDPDPITETEIRPCSRPGWFERDGATRMIFATGPARVVKLCKQHRERFDLGRALTFRKIEP